MMLVEKSQYEALLEFQRNYVPCNGNHQWVDDEENEGDQYCEKCMVIKE